MTAKEELLKFIFDNEFITKPRLKNDFELLVNKVIDEAQQQVKNLNIPAVVGRSEQLICPCCGSDKTYKTDAIHCNRCAVTTEI